MLQISADSAFHFDLDRHSRDLFAAKTTNLRLDDVYFAAKTEERRIRKSRFRRHGSDAATAVGLGRGVRFPVRRGVVGGGGGLAAGVRRCLLLLVPSEKRT